MLHQPDARDAGLFHVALIRRAQRCMLRGAIPGSRLLGHPQHGSGSRRPERLSAWHCPHTCPGRPRPSQSRSTRRQHPAGRPPGSSCLRHPPCPSRSTGLLCLRRRLRKQEVSAHGASHELYIIYLPVRLMCQQFVHVAGPGLLRGPFSGACGCTQGVQGTRLHMYSLDAHQPTTARN